LKTQNLEIGYLGEVIGKKYLQKKGYKFIEQNYRTKYAEIDLIFRHKKTLVFVEVRTKTGQRFGTPEDSFNRKKINKLIKNAAAYAAQKGYVKGYRIDALCVVLGEGGKLKRITHYQNIT
jgi:putative endonuclease